MEADPTVTMSAFSNALSHVVHDASQAKESGDVHWSVISFLSQGPG